MVVDFMGMVIGSAPTSSGVYQEATTWSLDTWGEYLMACSSKGWQDI